MVSLCFLLLQQPDPMMDLYDAITSKNVKKTLSAFSVAKVQPNFHTGLEESDILLREGLYIWTSRPEKALRKELAVFGHPTERRISAFRSQLVSKARRLFPTSSVSVTVLTEPDYEISECEEIKITEQRQNFDTLNYINFYVNYRTSSIYTLRGVWRWKCIEEQSTATKEMLLKEVRLEGPYESIEIRNRWIPWERANKGSEAPEEPFKYLQLTAKMTYEQKNELRRQTIIENKSKPHYGELFLITEIKAKRGFFTDTYWFNQKGEEIPFYPPSGSPPTSRKTSKIIKPN